MRAIFKREFLSYFRGVRGFLIIGLMLMMEGTFAVISNLVLGLPNFEYSLLWLSATLIVIIPLLSMKSVAGDRRGHTDQLLASLPLSAGEIVLGKFLATYTVFAIPVLFSGLYALLLCPFGSVNLLAAYASEFTLLLLGGALLAMCMFLSSLAGNQAIVAVMGIVACVILYLFSLLATIIPATPLVSFLILIGLVLAVALCVGIASRSTVLSLVTAACGMLPAALFYALKPELYRNLAVHLFQYIAPFLWFENISQNLIFDIRGIFFMLSFAAFFLFLTVVSVGKRRV